MTLLHTKISQYF